MASAWVHCNVCMSQDFRELHMTSCGKVVCAGCRPRLSSIHCEDCKGPCAKTVKIDHQAPKEVLRMFEDPSKQLKTVAKINDFQNKQKRQLLSFHRQNYKREQKKLKEMENRHDDMMERLRSLDLHEKDLDRKVAEAEARNKRLKAALAKQQQQRSQETFEPNPFQGNDPKDALSSSVNEYEAIGDPAMMSTPLAKCKLDTSSAGMFQTPGLHNMSATSRGFLEMKTPAAWNAHQRPQQGGSQDFHDRHRPSPRQPSKPSPLNPRHHERPSPLTANVRPSNTPSPLTVRRPLSKASPYDVQRQGQGRPHGARLSRYDQAMARRSSDMRQQPQGRAHPGKIHRFFSPSPGK